MFKRVIAYKGFWKSVAVLGLVYMLVLFFMQWAMVGFSNELFFEKNLFLFIVSFFFAGFICGFAVSYGKFWGKLKQEDYKK